MSFSSASNPAVIDRVPFGVPAFDRVTGGVPSRCVSLVFGPSHAARWAACLAFSNVSGGTGVPPAVISPAEPVRWAEAAVSGGFADPPDVKFLQIAQQTLTSQLARDAWMEMLPTLEGCRNGRVAFCSALPWLSFVPERNAGEYISAFIGALDELCTNVLLVLPEPASPRAAALIRHLEAACPVVIQLEPGEEARSVHWTTRRFDGSSTLPAFDLAEGDLSELPKRAMAAEDPVRKSVFANNKPTISLDYARLMGMGSETKKTVL
jgi:hypothetical protein